MPQKIFLSYRRDDGAGETGRLSDKLSAEFGKERLFLDVEGVRPGRDFHKQLSDAISNSAVLLAVIGPHWLDARDEENNRRIDDPNDWVRLEISAALKRDIPVIPVLLDGTKIPKANLLPEDLRGLSTRGAIEVHHTSFHSDTDRLVRELKETLFNSEPPIQSRNETLRAAGKPSHPRVAQMLPSSEPLREPSHLRAAVDPPIPPSEPSMRSTSIRQVASASAWFAGSFLSFFANGSLWKHVNADYWEGLFLLEFLLFVLLARWLPTAPLTKVTIVGFLVGFVSMASAVFGWAMVDKYTFVGSESYHPLYYWMTIHLSLTAVLWLLLRKPRPWAR